MLRSTNLNTLGSRRWNPCVGSVECGRRGQGTRRRCHILKDVVIPVNSGPNFNHALTASHHMFQRPPDAVLTYSSSSSG